MNNHRFCFSCFLSIIVITLLLSCRKESSLNQASTRDSFSIETRASYDNGNLDNDLRYDISEDIATRYVKESDKSAIIRSIEPYISKGVVSFYVVNLEKGWMIISSDARTKAVLAKGESGSFDLSARDNTNLQFWLQDMADQILAVKQSDIVEIDHSWKQLDLFKRHPRVPIDSLYRSSPVNTDSIWIVVLHSSDTTTHVILDVPHLLETKWGQGEPWNMALLPFCTDGKYYVTGCVPTAIAQIMYYYHHLLGRPSGLYHSMSILSMTPHIEWYYDPYLDKLLPWDLGDTTSVSRMDYQSATSRWDLMPLDSLSAVADLTGAGYVSDLMIDIGNRLNAHYFHKNTSVSPMSGTLEMDLSRSNLDYSFGLYNNAIRDSVFSNLLNSRPVMVQAQPQGSTGGHCWIIDGGYHSETTVTNTYTYHYVSLEDGSDWPSPSSGVIVDWFISLQELNWFYPHAPQQYDQVISTFHERFFRMNWGYDGRDDDGCYSCGINDNWHSYSTNKSIYYNLLPSTSFEYVP